MTSLLERPRLPLSVLGLIVLAAVVGSMSASRDARAAEQTADGAQASATLTARSTRFGRILFDGRGRALYGFTRDRRGGPSQCHGACARAWPVYFAPGKLRAGEGVKRSRIGTTRRPDGRRQVTYNGWPLYYYVGDRSPGQVLCQNVDEFGGTWLVVRPSGGLVR
jgi:predicted lipoprotein with Yx(FWY)xxD motif